MGLPGADVEAGHHDDGAGLDRARQAGAEVEVREQRGEGRVRQRESDQGADHALRPATFTRRFLRSSLVPVTSPLAPTVKRTAVCSSPTPVSSRVP